MNYINYFKHTLFTPDTYHRRFDTDLPKVQDDAKDVAKRIALAALPFAGLCPFAKEPLSLVMNTSRLFTHLQNAIVAEDTHKWLQCASECTEASVAALSLGMTFFAFTPGLFITTGHDLFKSACGIYRAVEQGDCSKLSEEAFSALISSAYLFFMATGSLEAMAAFALLQLALSLQQAYVEFENDRPIEGCAKLAMAFVRGNQAKHYMGLIQKRNDLLAFEKTKNLFLQALRGKQASHLIHHPLSSLQERIEKDDTILTDSQGTEHHFGAHFHGAGGALVKGENIAMRTRIIDGKEVTEIDFKINHAFRDHLEESIRQLRTLSRKEIKEVLSLAGSHATGISILQGSFFQTANLWDDDLGKAHNIQIEGLGSILIGSESNQPTLYDRVIIRLDSDKTLFELHELLSFVDLDRSICLSTKDDLERLKMGHLFRNFFPREATPFEREEEFFALSLGGLKAKMIELAPDMEEIFESYLHRMSSEQLLDGRIRYRIEGLADAAYNEGARALTAAIMGAHSDKELFERVASILKMGMISTETRHANDFQQHGLGGGGIDYLTGGADSIFTQLFTEKNCRDQMSVDSLYYHSKVRLLISLNALELGSYQYNDDSFGTRVYENDDDWWMNMWLGNKYRNRENILEFIRTQQQSWMRHGGHEIMLKERIAPSFFTGLIVPNERTKSDLLSHLKSCGLVENGSILNIPIDRFIRVGTEVTEDLISPLL